MTLRILAAVAGAFVGAAVVASAVVDAGLDHGRGGWGEVVVTGCLALGIAVVGWVVATRAQPVVGCLLLALALLVAVDALVPRLAARELLDRGRTDLLWPRVLLAVPWWGAIFLCLALVGAFFPDGRLPARRWRWVPWSGGVGVAAITASDVLARRPYDGPFAEVPGPVPGAPAWPAETLSAVGLALLGAALVGSVVALVWRYRRATGVRRLQLKWLVWGASLLPLTLVVCVVSALLLGRLEEAVVAGLFVATLVTWAGSIALALTRYRLYEIDRLVNRTLVYGAVTSVVALGWLGVALLAGLAGGRGSVWLTAGLAVAATASFRPLRARAQAVVDRRFDRERYEGLRRVREFEVQVREGRAEPEQVGTVVAAVLRDPTSELLFLLPASGRWVDRAGVERRPPVDSTGTRIERNGEAIGLFLHGPELAERPFLLRSVLAASALTVELARLRLELRVQLAEVEDSRARILQAGYEERRRLERDLHDGAQQRLVSLGISLRRMERSLPAEARVLRPALAQAVEEIGRALTDLRTLAGGIRPPRLDEGLAAALGDLARAAPVPVQVDVTGDRLPAEIEAAAYFTACEAVTNAVKHAVATRIWVRACRNDDRLSLSIGDDGIGGATAAPGSGLAGLADRIAAHHGLMRVDSPPGGGTRIEVELPCGS
jgi:signal transduction histidine kinase